MRFVLAIILGIHGIAHFVGFVSSWRIATLAELPYRTTIFAGRIDIGDGGTRLAGMLWLLTGLAFLMAAVAAVAQAPWVGRFAAIAVVASLFLCLAGWPDSGIGVGVNVGLGLLLAVVAYLDVAALTP